METLPTQMIAAHKISRDRAPVLLDQHGISISRNEIDNFMLHVQQKFFLGVHHAYQDAILRGLQTKLGAQQDIAEALGLRDRSSISQMLRSGKMDGIRITAALYQVPEIELPTQERAALSGFARAASYVKALALKDKNIEGSLTAQDFSYLVGILANYNWDQATRAEDSTLAHDLAATIIKERTITTFEEIRNNNHRPEQLVLKLQALRIGWGDFAVITLWAIPECIPTSEKRA